jgi:quinol monooxygenase YgiN
VTMVWVDLKPGAGGCQPILDFLSEILPDTRAFDGCQGLKVQEEGNGEALVFSECWDSAAHYQRYLDWRTQSGVLNKLVELLAEPPVIRIAEDIGV